MFELTPLYLWVWENKENSLVCTPHRKRSTWKNNQNYKAHSLQIQMAKDDLDGQLGLKCLMPNFTLGNLSRVASSKKSFPRRKHKNVSTQSLGWDFTHITVPYPFTKCPWSQTSEKHLGIIPSMYYLPKIPHKTHAHHTLLYKQPPSIPWNNRQNWWVVSC